MFHKIIEEQMEALKGYVKNEKEVSEEAEIDEGEKELDEEDKEKIADVVDTEDLGAKADYEYSKEVNK